MPIPHATVTHATSPQIDDSTFVRPDKETEVAPSFSRDVDPQPRILAGTQHATVNQNSALAKTDEQVQLISQHIQSMSEEVFAENVQGQSIQQVQESFIGNIQKLIELVTNALDSLRQRGAEMMSRAVEIFSILKDNAPVIGQACLSMMRFVIVELIVHAERKAVDKYADDNKGLFSSVGKAAVDYQRYNEEPGAARKRVLAALSQDT